MTTNNPIAFNTKEELLEFSNNNDYNVKENTENLIKFIKDNAGKFLYLRGANLELANLEDAKGVYGLNRMQKTYIRRIFELNNNDVAKNISIYLNHRKNRYNKQPIKHKKHNKNKVVIFCDEFKSFNDFLINNDDQKMLDFYVNKYGKTIYERKI